ncbi:hypothetical protein [Guptibacillus hwajinpoensis]|uniref:Uncharacterized protein n=1 Tax=Guptibacillus hwajinpoensis TaxID=208199 RepID=A0ABU0JX36_9BACL|nr:MULTISPECIES: hypothetical protein [Alkalihalobacillus]MDP4550255.1 hypothetical protein [Alkalihalobacillus macyae]MDQ0481652.1 hypothetical protein [Alkalihalobacillus hemicentroti]
MRISKLIVILSLLVVIYEYRYRILNWALGIAVIRRFVVGNTLKVPGVRKKLFTSFLS